MSHPISVSGRLTCVLIVTVLLYIAYEGWMTGTTPAVFVSLAAIPSLLRVAR